MTELVEIAFVGDEAEAMMIQALLEEHGIPSLQQQVAPSGPQLGYGLMNPGGGARRVMVHAQRADQARSLVAAARAEHEALPEPVNAEYLADAQSGRKPRSYGLIGAYARIYLVSFGAMAMIFAAYLLLRAAGLT
jgi:hypothetical protein